jgi:purine-binding chemotaxis protein CheW
MAGHLVIATIAGERIAFASDEIESVVEIGAITPVPGAAPHVAGLAALRSRVLTVIDCRASLEAGTAIADRRDALVTAQGGHLYALLVERVEDVAQAEGDVAPPPPGLSANWTRIVRGHAAAGGELFMLGDVAALIAGPNSSLALNQPLTLRGYEGISTV